MKLHVSTGKYKNTVLKVPKVAKPVKNIIKQSVFNYLDNIGAIKDATVLDLYSGSGNLGIESLSRGSRAVTFVDNDYEAVKCINENLQKLNILDENQVVNRDSLKYVGESEIQFSLVFADPPYNEHTKHLLKTVHYVVEPGGLFVYMHNKNNTDLDAFDLNLVETRCFGKSCFTVYKA